MSILLRRGLESYDLACHVWKRQALREAEGWKSGAGIFAYRQLRYKHTIPLSVAHLEKCECGDVNEAALQGYDKSQT